eukprot:g55527.t1
MTKGGRIVLAWLSAVIAAVLALTILFCALYRAFVQDSKYRALEETTDINSSNSGTYQAVQTPDCKIRIYTLGVDLCLAAMLAWASFSIFVLASQN